MNRISGMLKKNFTDEYLCHILLKTNIIPQEKGINSSQKVLNATDIPGSNVRLFKDALMIS